MYSYRRYSRRYRRFRHKSRAHHYGCLAMEFSVALLLVYKFLAPLICR